MKRKSVDDAALESEIARLPDLDLPELRARWKKLFGHPAPKSLRRKFLAKAVAYQMRVEAYGGLSPVVRRRLREIADAVRRGDVDAVLGSPGIKRGTQMIRQWKGKTLTVTALDNGFEFEGRILSSLSAIAKAITGTKREDGTFSRSDFRYDPASDVYHCRGGKRRDQRHSARGQDASISRQQARLRCVPT